MSRCSGMRSGRGSCWASGPHSPRGGSSWPQQRSGREQALLGGGGAQGSGGHSCQAGRPRKWEGAGMQETPSPEEKHTHRCAAPMPCPPPGLPLAPKGEGGRPPATASPRPAEACSDRHLPAWCGGCLGEPACCSAPCKRPGKRNEHPEAGKQRAQVGRDRVLSGSRRPRGKGLSRGGVATAHPEPFPTALKGAPPRSVGSGGSNFAATTPAWTRSQSPL